MADVGDEYYDEDLDDGSSYVPRPMEFRLVEIVDHDPIEPTPEMLAENPRAKKMVVSGKRGQTTEWDEDQQKYLVQTFDGIWAHIPEENLREFTPSSGEAGGFDAAWPSSAPREEMFSQDVLDALWKRGFCVIQMINSQSDAENALKAAQEQETWTRIIPEFEKDYFGREPTGKAFWVTEEGKSGNAISQADDQLSELQYTLMALSPSFGFNPYGRINGLVRMKCSAQDEEYLKAMLNQNDGLVTGIEMQDHLAFQERRKLSMIYFVHGSGGDLVLHRRGEDADSDVSLQIKQGLCVVMRTDELDFTYKPEQDSQLALQTWILREPAIGEKGLDTRDPTVLMGDMTHIPAGPAYGGSGQSTDIMALAPRIPGETMTPEEYWAFLSVGADVVIIVPQSRWDHTIYWEPETQPGKAYVRHFGMLGPHQMDVFDNNFFGISEEDAWFIDPPSRCCMEQSYDALYRGGWNKKSLKGAKIAMCMGYSDTEFDQLAIRTVYLDGSYRAMDPRIKLCRENAVAAARLGYVLGIDGPSATIETACSSSLSAVGLMHTWMRPQESVNAPVATRKQMMYGLGAGSNGHFDPFYTISLCGASMLTHAGRCFTFDQSADGFARGEGTAFMYFKQSEGEDLARLAMLCGTCLNQDGRSASLTAPHGPSQQECIRYSLREAGIASLDIQIQELHGTGTALGDPIEVGALRATMMAQSGKIRDHPLVKTSSKSNISHTEMCAGVNGLMKCVLMGIHCVAVPNVHLRLLNPHIDSNGYPVYFTPEFVDQGGDTGYHGVSSFGFGGSNARGDIWVRCLSGPRNTEPGKTFCDLTRERIEKWDALSKKAKPRATQTQLERDTEQGHLTGAYYVTGSPLGEEHHFYCMGTYNGGKSMDQMQPWPGGGYAMAFFLGETKIEHFQICVNMLSDSMIFPKCRTSDPSTTILGPGAAPASFCWTIDARDDADIPVGQMYVIIFKYDPETRQKSISWEPSSMPEALPFARECSVEHRYSVMASWLTWQCADMEKVPGEKGVWETSFKISVSGEEEFRILRDRDPRQTIHPATSKCMKTSVPLRGPDDKFEKRNWLTRGPIGEKVRIRLRVQDGDIEVSTSSSTKGLKRWLLGREPLYYITASWTNWACVALQPQKISADEKIWTTSMVMRDNDYEAFQIVCDEDFTQAIHPEMQLAPQGVSPAVGPDAKGQEMYWAIFAKPGETVEIRFDPRATDKRYMVTWDDSRGTEAVHDGPWDDDDGRTGTSNYVPAADGPSEE